MNFSSKKERDSIEFTFRTVASLSKHFIRLWWDVGLIMHTILHWRGLSLTLDKLHTVYIPSWKGRAFHASWTKKNSQSENPWKVQIKWGVFPRFHKARLSPIHQGWSRNWKSVNNPFFFSNIYQKKKTLWSLLKR